MRQTLLYARFAKPVVVLLVSCLMLAGAIALTLGQQYDATKRLDAIVTQLQHSAVTESRLGYVAVAECQRVQVLRDQVNGIAHSLHQGFERAATLTRASVQSIPPGHLRSLNDRFVYTLRDLGNSVQQVGPTNCALASSSPLTYQPPKPGPSQ